MAISIQRRKAVLICTEFFIIHSIYYLSLVNYIQNETFVNTFINIVRGIKSARSLFQWGLSPPLEQARTSDVLPYPCNKPDTRSTKTGCLVPGYPAGSAVYPGTGAG